MDVPTPRIAIDDRTDGQRVRNQRQVNERIGTGARITVGRRRVAGVESSFGGVDLGLVGDIAQHSGLGAGAKERTLRTFQNLDTLEVDRINIEIAPRQLCGLVIEIHCYVRERAGPGRNEVVGLCRGEPAHVNLTLARTVGRHRDIGEIPQQVIEVLHVELSQRCARQCGNGDRYVLQVFGATSRCDDHFLELIAGGGRGCCRWLFRPIEQPQADGAPVIGGDRESGALQKPLERGPGIHGANDGVSLDSVESVGGRDDLQIRLARKFRNRRRRVLLGYIERGCLRQSGAEAGDSKRQCDGL